MLLSASFLAADTVWHHTVNIEVYLPMVACVASAAALGVSILEGRPFGPRWRMLALVAGISVGVHAEAVLLAGLVGVVVLVKRISMDYKRPLALLKELSWPALLFFSGGLLVLLYLPLRASAGAELNWGNPSTWSGFVEHITAESIRRSFAQQMSPGFATALVNAHRYIAQLFAQVGPLLLVAIASLLWLMLRRFWSGLLLAVVWIGDMLFSVFVNPMAQLEHQTSTVSFWIMAALAAVTLQTLTVRMANRRSHDQQGRGGQWNRPPMLPAVLAGLLLAWPLLSPMDRSLRSSELGYEFGLEALQKAAPGAVYLTAGDDLSGQSLYFRLVERRRPDVVHAVRQMICDPGFLTLAQRFYVDPVHQLGNLSELASAVCEGPGRMAPPSPIWQPFLAGLREKNVPVVWESSGESSPEEILAAPHLTPGFPASALNWHAPDLPPGASVNEWLAPASLWYHARFSKTLPDALTGWVVSELAALYSTRVRPTNEGQRASLVAFLRAAVALGPSSCKARNNLLANLLYPSSMQEALALAQESLPICGDHMLLHVNAARTFYLSRMPELGQDAVSLARARFPAEALEPRLENLARQLSKLGLSEYAQEVSRR